MKKLIISVMFGLLAGLAYMAASVSVCAPLLLLSKFGLVELFTGGAVDFRGAAACVAGNSAFPSLGPVSIAAIAVQAVLCVGAGVMAFAFMKSVLKVHLPGEVYFRRLYEAVFFALFVAPEAVVVLSVLFGFPAAAAVAVLAALAGLAAAFAVAMSARVLPDLMRNGNRRDILKEA